METGNLPLGEWFIDSLHATVKAETTIQQVTHTNEKLVKMHHSGRGVDASLRGICGQS